jgi:N-acetylmuramoyl-L-alanine amidase
MATRHVVKPGEHLSHIAALYGFSDYKAIWDFGENAELRKKRKDPHILAPGDVVMVPAPRKKTVTKAAGSRHRFRLASVTLHLRVRLLDRWDRKLHDAPCWFRIDDTDDQGNPKKAVEAYKPTDKEGLFEFPVTRTAVEGELEVQPSAEGDRQKEKFDLFVGGLDPVTTDSGMRARLNNLGYFAGLTEGFDDREQLRWALEEFQFDHKIKPQNGDLDDSKNQAKIAATRKKLVEVHGDKEPL